MPAKLQQILVIDNHGPLVVDQFRRRRHSCLLEDRLTIWYKRLRFTAPRREIVAAAADLFHKQGVVATSPDQIIDAPLDAVRP